MINQYKHLMDAIGFGRMERENNPFFFYFGAENCIEGEERRASSYLAKENSIRIVPANPRAKIDRDLHYKAIRFDPIASRITASNCRDVVDALMKYHGEDASLNLMSALEKAAAMPNDGLEIPKIAGMSFKSGERLIMMLGVNTKGKIQTELFDPQTGQLKYTVASIDINNSGRIDTIPSEINIDTENPYKLAERIFYKFTADISGVYTAWCVTGIKSKLGSGPGGWSIGWKNSHGLNEKGLILTMDEDNDFYVF